MSEATLPSVGESYPCIIRQLKFTAMAESIDAFNLALGAECEEGFVLTQITLIERFRAIRKLLRIKNRVYSICVTYKKILDSECTAVQLKPNESVEWPSR